MEVGGRRLDIGALIFGGVLLVVGLWFLLTETFGMDLPLIDWDQYWPLLLIGLGALIVVRAATHRRVVRPD